MEEDKSELLDVLRQAVELAMPDLRHYFKLPKKAKVVASYESDGDYYCDVQPLRNDETVDDKEPVISKVEIPVLWGGPDRGVVCPPVVGVHCDLTYYDGDPNYPRVSNFRWYGQRAPKAELNEFIIQLEPGVSIHIDKNKRIATLTPENIYNEAGKDWTVKAGNNASIEAGNDANIKAGNNASITAAKEATLQAGTMASIIAPLINLWGRLVCKPYNGEGIGYAEFCGDVLIRGNQKTEKDSTVQGNSSVMGDSSIGGDSKITGSSRIEGESYASSRTGGSC